MFASKKPSLNEWKNWAIGLVGNTMSSIDQATSRWFLNLINGLPRDYFAKTFDQVNYLDKRVWEGMFRASIEEIKEQLELRVSESIVEANLVKLQGLIGKYSLSPVIYENGLKELEDFISNLSNAGNYLKVLKGIRSEFREELKLQPALLKECIEGEANLGRKESEYYKSLLDDRSLKNTSPERVISESPILDKAAVSKRGNNNYKLRNISKLLFSNPGQALTLFLAAQSAFASAANIQMSNSSAMENSVVPLSSDTFPLSQLRGDMSLSMKNNSTKGINSKFAEIYYGREGAREVLTYAQKSKSQDAERYKRSPESDSSDGFSSLSGSDEVEGLKIEKKKLEENLESIKEYSRISHANFTETISQLRGENEKLWKDVDNSKRSEIQTNNKMERDKESFLGRINELQGNITRLNNQLIKESRAFLPYVCIKDIENSRFDPAEEKLKEMNDDETKEVINRVYNNNAEGRFALLLEFCRSLRSIPLTFKVCTYLDNEMGKSGDNDFSMLTDLVEVVRLKVTIQRKIPLREGVEDNLSTTLAPRLAGYIKDVMSSKEYHNLNSEAKDRFDSIKGKLPESVRALYFASTVCLRNRYYNLYLCRVHGNGGRQFKLKGCKDDQDANAAWKIDLNEYDSPRIFFTITNPINETSVSKPIDWTFVEIEPIFKAFPKEDGFNIRAYAWPATFCLIKHLRSDFFFLSACDSFQSEAVWLFKDCGSRRKRRDMKKVQDIGDSTIKFAEQSVSPSPYFDDISLEKTKESNSSFVSR